MILTVAGLAIAFHHTGSRVEDAVVNHAEEVQPNVAAVPSISAQPSVTSARMSGLRAPGSALPAKYAATAPEKHAAMLSYAKLPLDFARSEPGTSARTIQLCRAWAGIRAGTFARGGESFRAAGGEAHRHVDNAGKLKHCCARAD